jgi:D-serine deaminase-like pyridoxal phosphate-dependent protein
MPSVMLETIGDIELYLRDFAIVPAAAAVEDLETPIPIIDVDIAERNILRWQQQCAARGLANRPHIKTHKLALWARRQIAHGAIGVTCQTLGEAEAMAAAGVTDILLATSVLGDSKLLRLMKLSRRVRVTVVADSAAVAVALSQAAAGSNCSIGVLVECDTGARRCGVATPEAAADLAQIIAGSPSLHFAGLMTFPKPGMRLESQNFLLRAKDLCERAGLVVSTISTGGTPDMWSNDGLAGITEYRAGTYIYNDRARIVRRVCELSDCALRVRATVVSRPQPTRAMIDAGSKALSSDLLGLDGYGFLPQWPDAKLPRLDEEHGYIEFANATVRPEVGEAVEIVPNHACVVSNLFDRVALRRGDRILGMIKVDARAR